MSSKHVPLESTADEVDFNDALNVNWEWSDSVTDFIADQIDGRSLKICTGLRPIADINLDLLPLRQLNDADVDVPYRVESNGTIVPEHGAHEAIGGRFIQGDMFDLPFDDKSFDTVVSDPPWREKTEAEREAMFEACLRVCKVGGKIIYNATWLPEAARSRLQDKRVRQQDDFWGNPSFITIFRRLPDEFEVVETYDYQVEPDADEDDPDYIPHNRRRVLAKYVDAEMETNPYIPDPYEPAYHCPKCGSTQLFQLGRDSQPNLGTDTYECHGCGYRVSDTILEMQAEQYEKAPVDSRTEWKAYLEARGFETWDEAVKHCHDVTKVAPENDEDDADEHQHPDRTPCTYCAVRTDTDVCGYCSPDSPLTFPTATSDSPDATLGDSLPATRHSPAD